jgi:hypothetical protein
MDQSVRDHVVACYRQEFDEWKKEEIAQHELRNKVDQYAIKRIEWALSLKENWAQTKKHIEEVVRMNKIVQENWIK